MRSNLAVLAVLASLLHAAPLRAAPPPGQSALLNGMHDIQSLGWMLTATTGCDRGWITDLQYIGSSGTASGACHSNATNQGISIIMRLDMDGSNSFPVNPGQVSGFSGSFASFVSGCGNIHVWIVGNEPNVSLQQSDPDCSSSAYASAYVAVYQAVHAVPGHGNDLLLVASNSPYSPGCLHSLRMIIQEIQNQGVTPDGFALHAYTRAPDGGSLSAAYVTDPATQNDMTIDECPGGATWNDTWNSHFRIYQDYITLIDAAGLAGSPVFITESGNACDVSPGNACYPNANVGYFQALYAEAAGHNVTAQTKIRAITPYRWTGFDDGTGRDFEIGARPLLLDDLLAAFAAMPSWTNVDCTPVDTCLEDSQCSGQQICDLATGQCIATTPCGPGGSCPADQLCRQPENDCVPLARGAAQLAITPPSPDPFQNILLDVFSTEGWGNVGLSIEGPSDTVATSWNHHENIAGVNHWFYDATAGEEGTYRATFVADPGASTVYGIFYFEVGSPTVDPDAGVGDAAVADGGPSDSGPSFDSQPGSDGAPDNHQGVAGGCNCRTGSEKLPAPLVWALLAWLWQRRRLRHAST